MRKLLSCLSLFLILFSLGKKADAQPQWKFHIAFEDATGAKDTIWCIWDSSAHLSFPVDTALGEGPVSMDYTQFNVFVSNANGDTTKTIAYPVVSIGHGAFVKAINYQYPINISWDSALFNAVFPWPFATIDEAWISNDYFFAINNSPLDQAFNMLLDNHVDAPSFNWFSQSQFPMNFNFARYDTSYVNVDEKQPSNIKLYPNPACNNVIVSSSDKIKKIDVFSEGGEMVFSKWFSETEFTNEFNLSIESLQSGLYLINIINFKNQIYHEKLIKTP